MMFRRDIAHVQPLSVIPESESLAVLLENHRKFLSFVQARVGDRATAEDIIQDAFVRNLSKIEELRLRSLKL